MSEFDDIMNNNDNDDKGDKGDKKYSFNYVSGHDLKKILGMNQIQNQANTPAQVTSKHEDTEITKKVVELCNKCVDFSKARDDDHVAEKKRIMLLYRSLFVYQVVTITVFLIFCLVLRMM